MKNQVNATVDCRIVGDYVDGTEQPVDWSRHKCEIVRPKINADFIDFGVTDDETWEVTETGKGEGPLPSNDTA